MVKFISRVSKGSKMDQIYIPKNRPSLPVGSYVAIEPIKTKEQQQLFFYSIKTIEPIKVDIIKRLFEIIDSQVENDNIIITGSFLNKGFRFNDIDIIVITSIQQKIAKHLIIREFGISPHIIAISNKSLIKGLSSDPLFQVMLSRCISKNRILYKTSPKPNWKLLDLHLMKSELLIENFDFLSGDEKYNLLRNLVALWQFTLNKKTTQKQIDDYIAKFFCRTDDIKDNLVNKTDFLRKYRKLLQKARNKIRK